MQPNDEGNELMKTPTTRHFGMTHRRSPTRDTLSTEQQRRLPWRFSARGTLDMIHVVLWVLSVALLAREVTVSGEESESENVSESD